MATELHTVMLRIIDEVTKMDEARLNWGEKPQFQLPRDAMLMAHSEWQSLLTSVKAATLSKNAEVRMILCFLRMAAVMVKAASDLSTDKTYPSDNVTLSRKAVNDTSLPEDYGFVVMARPHDTVRADRRIHDHVKKVIEKDYGYVRDKEELQDEEDGELQLGEEPSTEAINAEEFLEYDNEYDKD